MNTGVGVSRWTQHTGGVSATPAIQEFAMKKCMRYQMKLIGDVFVYIVDGVTMTHEEFAAKYPGSVEVKDMGEPLAGHTRSCWPMVSEALAVHPAQVDQANRRNAKHGIAARYEKGTGACQIDSRGDRAKLLKLEAQTLGHAVFDKNGGYSDG